MQSKQSVTTSNNQPSTATSEKHSAMKLPIASTVIAAFGLLSMLLAVSETAHAQGTADATPVVFQAAGPDNASIQGAVDSFRALLGDNNLKNQGRPPKGRLGSNGTAATPTSW